MRQGLRGVSGKGAELAISDRVLNFQSLYSRKRSRQIDYTHSTQDRLYASLYLHREWKWASAHSLVIYEINMREYVAYSSVMMDSKERIQRNLRVCGHPALSHIHRSEQSELSQWLSDDKTTSIVRILLSFLFSPLCNFDCMVRAELCRTAQYKAITHTVRLRS